MFFTQNKKSQMNEAREMVEHITKNQQLQHLQLLRCIEQNDSRKKNKIISGCQVYYDNIVNGNNVSIKINCGKMNSPVQNKGFRYILIFETNHVRHLLLLHICIYVLIGNGLEWHTLLLTRTTSQDRQFSNEYCPTSNLSKHLSSKKAYACIYSTLYIYVCLRKITDYFNEALFLINVSRNNLLCRMKSPYRR